MNKSISNRNSFRFVVDIRNSGMSVENKGEKKEGTRNKREERSVILNINT